jgi:Arylsulfotransferase (ASST)
MTSQRLRAALVVAVGAALLTPPPAAGAVAITASPGLKPRFDRSVPDYVVRCKPGTPVRFSVSASDSDTVAIGDGAKRGGDFTAEASLATGAAVALRVTTGGRNSTHHVRCLPQDFPGWKVHRHRKPQAQWYVLTPIGPHTDGYVAVFDARGVPLWWMHSSWYGPWDGKLLVNGNMMWSRQFNTFFGVSPREAWEEYALDGRRLRVLQTVGSPTDVHDLEQLPNGNYLLDTYRRRSGVNLKPYGGPKKADVYDAEIQELTPKGKRVWRWNSKNRIALSERSWSWAGAIREQQSKPPAERAYDLVHINSMEPDGGGIVVSARFLDAVFRIDRKTKRITWKLGGTQRPESLDVKGDPLGSRPFGGQHDARLYSDHTLTVYDNGASGGPAKKRPPRAVRYRIDTKKGTATLLEDVREKAVANSGWGGGARKLPEGNWVVNWGGSRLMSELTPLNKRVLEIEFDGDRYGYRAFPIPPRRLTAQQLRKGMDAILTAGRGEVAASR